MTSAQTIENKTNEFIKNQDAFTSVDIGNAVKKDGAWIRNRDIANWLRKNFQDQNYQRSNITVEGNRAATLYHPDFMDAENYEDTEQQAISFNQFKQMFPKATTQNQTTQNQTPRVSSKPASQPSSKSKRISTSNKRIRIPAVIVRQLGWKPGDLVDSLKIVTQYGCTSRKHRVHKDGRVHIHVGAIDKTQDNFKVEICYDSKDDKIRITKV